MKSIISGLSASLLALLASLAAANSDDRPVLVGHVFKIIDGDTIDVRLQSGPIRIRFHGIDAPERTQAHGKEATAALASLIMGKEVQIDPFEQDRYDRLVGIVFLGELNVNADLVRRGHAWAFRRYMRKADAGLCSMEDEARQAQRGLWASANPIPPWSHRRRNKATAVTPPIETTGSCVAAIGRPYS